MQLNDYFKEFDYIMIIPEQLSFLFILYDFIKLISVINQQV